MFPRIVDTAVGTSAFARPELDGTLVVDVAGLAVDDIAEHTLLDEIETEHLFFAVAAVFEHHARHARALARLDHLPALFDRKAAGNLRQRDLAVFHRAAGDIAMNLPRRNAVDDIDVVKFAGLPITFGADKPSGGRLAVAFEPPEFGIHLGLKQIAHADDLGTRNHRDAVNGGRAAHAETDDGDPHLLHRLEGETLHRSADGAVQLQSVAHASRCHRDRAHPRRSLQKITPV